MTPALLLEHFDRLSEAPDAVARLRRFVLDLAVRGKLVSQDPNDEFVSESARRPTVTGSSDGLFDLPASWTWVRVGAVAEARLGKMLDKGKNKGTPRPYLRNINVRWFDFDLSDLSDMRFEDSELREFALRCGDVLICEGGEPGRSAVWDERATGIYFQKAIHRVRFSEHVDGRYFVRALRASADDGRLAEYFTGTGIKHFTGRGLDAYLFPLPPLAEQHRIVAKVDELMALCDQLEAAQKEREARRDRLTVASLGRLTGKGRSEDTRGDIRFVLGHLERFVTRPDHVNRLRNEIATLAITGRLVPQVGGDEAATEVLRRSGLSGERPDPMGAGSVLPYSWEWVRFETVAAVTGGVTLGRKLGSRKLARAPYLRVANVKRGEIDISVVKEIEIPEDEIRKYCLIAGDLLLTEGGDWDKVGRAAIWRGELPLCLHQNHVFRARLRSPEMSTRWFELYFNSGAGRRYFESASKQTTNLASINMRQVRGCPVPIPPVLEQQRIVTRVDELMMLCDEIELALRRSMDTGWRLFDTLLHSALDASVEAG